MIYTIIVNGRLPGTNDLIATNRIGWYSGANNKKVNTTLCELGFKSFVCHNKVKTPLNSLLDIHIVWYEPNHRRDHDNILGGGLKQILDGAVKAGFIPDDSQKYIRDIYSHIEVDKTNPRVEITFKEVEDDKTCKGC